MANNYKEAVQEIGVKISSLQEKLKKAQKYLTLLQEAVEEINNDAKNLYKK